jgi:hypothetical protein
MFCLRVLEGNSPLRQQLQRRSEDYCTGKGVRVSSRKPLRAREQANVAANENCAPVTE